MSQNLSDKNNFKIPLEIEVITQNEKLIKKVWVDGKAEVEFKLKEKPMKIILDPNEWMMNKNKEYGVNEIEVKVE